MQDIGTAKEHNLIQNEGAVYIGDFSEIQATKEFIEGLKEKMLGVFKDKLQINAKPKIRDIKNAAGKVKGWQDIDQWDVKITGDLLDFNSKLLESSLLKKEKEGHYIAQVGILDESDYKDALIVGENIKGEYNIILVKDIINKEGLNFEMKSKDESAFKISLENAYDTKTIPLEIFTNFKDMESSHK
ncbi:hypothetical protein ACSW8Q_17915 (plasmid) [Clostridium perfringens]|uniref:hypothetical protein n=1 Tax=Clostridium perfringens TaxID=1502 RepID=UPI0013E384E0|nr:hypothetical protein [Clostridium perfringens]EJT6665750.1 hypothetical protein [Clostridium perfringens]MDM0552403.1 hypothetical protein [Clostridium perfringens]NGT07404.1 hypothetical protein [Clostridium perfringens]HAT4181223.1 hypothetical protein [Clostridium perfringens]HAT4331045.1 hypothetical protein [Clostridium perfringens]